MRRLVCIIGALAFTAGGAGASTVSSSSGLKGVVYAAGGGACLDNGCSGRRPVPGLTLVFSAAGRASVTTSTRDDGSFRVRLAPGTYGVRPVGPRATRHLSPTRATVTRGSFRSVTFVVAGPKIP